jgi:hypothetical protein
MSEYKMRAGTEAEESQTGCMAVVAKADGFRDTFAIAGQESSHTSIGQAVRWAVAPTHRQR